MNLIPALQVADVPYGVRLEWMPILSVIVPAGVLIVIIYLGSKNTV